MKILVTLELDAQIAKEVLDKATRLCGPDDQMTVVTVVDPKALSYVADPTLSGTMMQANVDQAIQVAREQLITLCAPYGIEARQCSVCYGRIAHEVHRVLDEGGYDLLVLGSHGHSGWRRLLGSVASSILHGVPVDTWVVKIAGVTEEKTEAG